MKKRWFVLLFHIILSALTVLSVNIQPAYTDIETSRLDYTLANNNTQQLQTEIETQRIVTEAKTESNVTEAPATEQTTVATVESTVTTRTETFIQPTTETTTISEEPAYTFGTAGRLEIPSVGVGVALYITDLYQQNVQSVVDAWDSAAVFPYRDSVTVIADHNNQGFASLKNVGVGDTAFISQQNGSFDTYVCTRVCYNGHNLGTELVDEYGEQVESNIDGELIMYTCNDCWQNITITYWQRTD